MTSRSPQRLGVAAIALAAGLLVATPSYAQDASEPSSPPLPTQPTQPTQPAPAVEVGPTAATAEDVARLDDALGEFASQSKNYRIWSAVAGIGVGAAAIPAGIIMLNRNDESTGGAIALGAGIGAAAGGLAVLAFGGVGHDFQLLHEELEHSTGKPPAEVIAAVEAKWKEKAEATRSARYLWGPISTAVGVASLGVGTAFAVASPVGDLTRNQQDTLGAALIGFGALGVIAGLQAWCFEEPIETAWRGYRAGKRGPTASSVTRSIGVAPTPGGAFFGLNTTF